jgi:hypothetical protein
MPIQAGGGGKSTAADVCVLACDVCITTLRAFATIVMTVQKGELEAFYEKVRLYTLDQSPRFVP